MHAVVAKLTLAKPIDSALLAKVAEFVPRLQEHAGFVDLKLVRVSDSEAIALIFYSTRAAHQEISSKVGAPWFAEHLRPYLAGPVNNTVGEVVAQAES